MIVNLRGLINDPYRSGPKDMADTKKSKQHMKGAAKMTDADIMKGIEELRKHL